MRRERINTKPRLPQMGYDRPDSKLKELIEKAKQKGIIPQKMIR